MRLSADAVVCDIEGTTSSIAFVKDVLFPYAATHLPEYLERCRDDPKVRRQLDAVARDCSIHDRDDLKALTDQLLNWIANDVKATPLKALQGLIWEHGYRSGAYQAHLYPDALEQLKAWHEAGLCLYIYSSGSIRAQELFFEHTVYGDLRGLFSGFFDTTTGPKREIESYQKITEALALPAERMLFLSDVEAELDAAAGAGLQTVWLLRPEDSALDPDRISSVHPVATSFDHIQLS